jgi:putative inorganic carbon (HCO3(-)) transporter
MRGFALGIAFFCMIPFIFIKGPFFGILMWYWVSLMNQHEIVWDSLFASVPYALIVAVLTLTGWLISRSEPKIPPLNKTTGLLLMLMLWISVTSLFGIGPRSELYDKWQLAEKMLLMTLVAYALLNSRERVERLIIVCVVSIGFWGFRGGLISIVTGGGSRVSGPIGSMIGDNNDLGVALTMILPLIFYLRERYKSFRVKWPVQILIGLTVLGDIFTYSRGALVALTAMGTMLWLRAKNKLPILIFVIVAAVGLWKFAPAEWTDRMMTIENYQQDGSAEGRLHMWHRVWVLAQMRPIVGGGFHWSYDPNTVNRLFAGTDLPKLYGPLAAHSIWFEMLGDHGFVGLGLFILILTSVFVDAQYLIRRTRRDPELEWANHLGRMIQVSLVGYCTGGSFATQGMYDGLYAIVVIAAAARLLVAAELRTRRLAAHGVRNFAAATKPIGVLTPQSSG